MSRARLVLLSSMAVLSIAAMLTSSASAAISFEWRVGGAALGSAEAEGPVQGLYAYPGRLGLGHAESLEDVQRLPEHDPRRVGPLRAER